MIITKDLGDVEVWCSYWNFKDNDFYKIDIDQDKSVDLEFSLWDAYGSSGSSGGIRVAPLNDFEIAYTSYIDTFWVSNPEQNIDRTCYTKSYTMPSIFDLNDT